MLREKGGSLGSDKEVQCPSAAVMVFRLCATKQCNSFMASDWANLHAIIPVSFAESKSIQKRTKMNEGTRMAFPISNSESVCLSVRLSVSYSGIHSMHHKTTPNMSELARSRMKLVQLTGPLSHF